MQRHAPMQASTYLDLGDKPLTAPYPVRGSTPLNAGQIAMALRLCALRLLTLSKVKTFEFSRRYGRNHIGLELIKIGCHKALCHL